MELIHPWELRESTRYPGRCFYFNQETKESRWIRPEPYPGKKSNVWPNILYLHHIVVEDSSANPRCDRTKDEARRKIERIAEDLREGRRTFEELAWRESDDDKTRADGGKIGWIKPGTMPLEFEKMAWQLEICEMSCPVYSKFGWHLILRRG